MTADAIVAPTDAQLGYIADLCARNGFDPPAAIHSSREASEIITALRTGSYALGFRIVRATQRVPALRADEARVFVTVEADETIFDPEAVAVIVTPRMVALAAEGEDADAD